MQDRTADTYDAQMQTYREHLRRLNRRLAEDYARQNAQHVILTIEALTQAAPVTLAIAHLHHAIRGSPARNFWPVIRKTKGVLLVRSAGAGQDVPWPWQRTTTGNMRYALPGYLLFSPWLPNVRRRVRNRTIELERVSAAIQSMADQSDVSIENLPWFIVYKARQARWLIDEIRAFQGFAIPDTMAALERWSDEPQRGSNIALRISQGALVYSDRGDHCEIEIPAALTKPLQVPSTPDRALELHWFRARGRSN